jgi:single-stranded DNA-binding protein
MELASHRRSRDEITSAWTEWTDYFIVKAFGFQAHTTHQHLDKGSGVAISGRLSSRSVLEPDGAHRREVEIIAEAVQFLSRPPGR